MRSGVRLAIDPGEVRIGVARSDPDGTLAVPVETVRRGDAELSQLASLVAEHAAVEVIVGLPVSLSGREGLAAHRARELAVRVARAVAPVPVRLVDERLTTVSAERTLRERGRRGHHRRAVVDQAAAVVLLQNALDTERTSGTVPGHTVWLES